MIPVRYLILWPTGACDLDCLYCYRSLRGGGRMTRETATAAVDYAASSGLPFHLQFAGGEPLLVPELVTDVISWVRQRQNNVSIAVQTNGTRITSELAEFFRAHDVQVGVSVDGPPSIHEELRGQAADTYRGLALLDAHGVRLRVTCVVTSRNVGALDQLVMGLAAFPHVEGLALDPLVSLGSALHHPDLAATGEQMRLGATRLYRQLAVVNQWRGTPLVWRELERVRASLKQVPKRAEPQAPFCHACVGQSMAVAPQGDVYPCSQAVGHLHRRAGNIKDLSSLQPAILAQAFERRQMRGPCHACPLAGRCPGDCPSRLSATPAEFDDITCHLSQVLAQLEGEQP